MDERSICCREFLRVNRFVEADVSGGRHGASKVISTDWWIIPDYRDGDPYAVALNNAENRGQVTLVGRINNKSR